MNIKWDRRFLCLAKEVSTWSKDPSTQVGAVIVGANHQVISMGYNGFPSGVLDSSSRLSNREEKLRFTVHAEQNAIIQAGHEARGCSIYVYPSFWHPNICHDCAKLAIQAGIREVIGYKADPNNPRLAAWKDSLELSAMMFTEAGVTWREVAP